MASMNYNIIRAAMQAKQVIHCTYQGYQREVCAHCIGLNKDGGEQVLAFQFAGGSSKGLPVGGQWRCLEISQLTSVRALPGVWHTGASHKKPNTCVKRVDFEVIG